MRKFLRATNLWQNNSILLRELKHFRWLLSCALIFTLVGAGFEGISVGFIASFLQGLTNPQEPPIQIGINWFDVWFLATEASIDERIYRLAGFIFILVWLRSLFIYLGVIYSRKTAFNLAGHIRKTIFEQLQSLPYINNVMVRYFLMGFEKHVVALTINKETFP